MLGEGGFIVESDGLALNAIQNFGAMDILCTDKTGTLTQNKVILERHLDVHGHEDIRVLEYAWLNSFNQTGLKNLLDVAALEYAQQHEIVEKLKHYRKIDEIPFDFVRRRMSVIVSNGGNQNLLVCKGAIEELLPLCVCADDRKAEAKGGVVPFTTEMRKEVRRVTRRLNQICGRRCQLAKPRQIAGGQLHPRRGMTAGPEEEIALLMRRRPRHRGR